MASVQFSHLHPLARPEAMMDEEARPHVLQRDRWVDYPRASQALAHLERLLLTPARSDALHGLAWRVEYRQDADRDEVPA